MDIKKVCDQVNWGFLLVIMEKWDLVLSEYDEWNDTSFWLTLQFLINKTPICFFQNSRGLRQGDPFFMGMLSCIFFYDSSKKHMK